MGYPVAVTIDYRVVPLKEIVETPEESNMHNIIAGSVKPLL